MKNSDKKGRVSADMLLKKLKPYLEEKSIVEEMPQQNKDGQVKAPSSNISNSTSLEEVSNEGASPSEKVLEHEVTEDFPPYIHPEHSSMTGDDANYNLMSIFGLEDEKPREKEEGPPDTKEKRRLIAETIDFTDREQVKRLKSESTKRYAYGMLGLIVTGVLFLFTLLCEGLSSLGFSLPALFDVNVYTKSALWMSLQVVVLALALQFEAVKRSIKELSYGIFTAGGVFVIYSAILALYYLFLIVTQTVKEVVTYNSLLLFAALISLICDILDAQSIMFSMKIVSSSKSKRVLLEPERKLLSDAKEMVGRYLPSNTPYLLCAEGANITDFGQRWTDKNNNRKLVGFMLVAALIASLIVGGANMSGGFYAGVKCAMSAFFFIVPLPFCLSFSHSVFCQDKKLYSHGATVIGERAFEQYKTPACLIINDRDIFSGSGKVQLGGIQGYSDTKIELALGYAAAIFTKLDCPLGKVFTDAASDYEVSDDVDIAFITDDGIEAAVEGVSVLVGNYNFIKEYDLLPEGENGVFENDDCYIYIAVENETCIRVQLCYTPSKEFERALRALLRKQVNVIIKTCDPNINMRLFERLMDIDRIMPIRIMRIKNAEEAKYDLTSDCSTGIVTTGGLRTLAYAFSSTGRVCGAVRGGIAVSAALAIAAMAFIISISVTTGFVGISSPLLLAYQLFWCLPVLLIDKILL